MGLLNVTKYGFNSETKTFTISVKNIGEISKNPIVVVNNDTKGIREFTFKEIKDDNTVLFTCEDLNMIIVEELSLPDY